RPGHVILTPQLIQDGTSDSRCGECTECEPAFRLKRLVRGHQSDRTGAYQFIEVRVCRQATRNLPRDEVHESQVLVEQLLSFVGATVGGQASSQRVLH